MKQNKNIADWWRNLNPYDKGQIIYLTALTTVVGGVLVFCLVTGIVPGCEKIEDKPDAKDLVDDFVPRDGTRVDLPPRTNTGDTFFVCGRDAKRDLLFLKPVHGSLQKSKIVGADKVLPGDTIVLHPKHKFLMKNITQRNKERQH